MDDKELLRNQILSLSRDTLIAERYRPVITSDGEEPERIRELGRGGSGVVILVEQPLAEGVSIHRAVKFYVLRDDIARLPANEHYGPISAQNFRDEILNISAFNHENVLKVIEAGIFSNSDDSHKIPILVTEYIDGPTLKHAIDLNLLQEYAQDDPKIVIDMIYQICRGVTHLHSRSFYHFDIAPKNIFLRGDGPNWQVVIGDLGIGKTITSNELGSQEMVTVVGTRFFCPPEFRNWIDTKVSLAEICTSQPRWDIYATATSALQVLDSIDFANRRRPAWLEALRGTLIDAQAGRRFESMETLTERVRLLDPTQHLTWGVPELSDGSTTVWLMAVENPSTTRRVRSIANHPALLRLKRVPQLMMMSKTFSGGNHTRYEHSLGAYQNARRYLLSLLSDREFLEFFSPAHVELALLSALLSNVTRFPLSSIVHEVRDADSELFPGFSRRELLAAIESQYRNPSLMESIGVQFPDVDLEALRQLLVGDNVSGHDDGVRFVHYLLNSSIDVRVIDYLRRDSLHLGITRGDPFDLNDLLSSMSFRGGELVVRSAGMSSVEQVVATRYWLHNRIYWNRPNRTMVAMIRHVLLVLLDSEGFAKEMFEGLLGRDEGEMLLLLHKAADASGRSEVVELVEYLTRGRPLKFEELTQLNRAEGDAHARAICDGYERLSVHEGRLLQRRLNDLFVEGFGEQVERVHVLIDMPVERGRMKLGEDINILTYREETKALLHLSTIVAGVRTGFEEHLQRLRVLIHPLTDARFQDPARRDALVQEVLRVLRSIA